MLMSACVPRFSLCTCFARKLGGGKYAKKWSKIGIDGKCRHLQQFFSASKMSY